MNKDQKFIAEAYDKVLAIETIAGKSYKRNLDHIKVEPYKFDKIDKQTIFRVREYDKNNQILSISYYRKSPEAFNDEESMVLSSTDITNILPEPVKAMVRKEVEELELKKMGLDQQERDTWRGVVGNL